MFAAGAELELAFSIFCLEHIRAAEVAAVALEPPPSPPPPPPAFPVALVCFFAKAEAMCVSGDAFLLAEDVVSSFRSLPPGCYGQADRVTMFMAQCADRCRSHRALRDAFVSCLTSTVTRLHEDSVFSFFLSCHGEYTLPVMCRFLLSEPRRSVAVRESCGNAMRLLEHLAPLTPQGTDRQLLIATLTRLLNGAGGDSCARLLRCFALRILEKTNL